MDAGEFDRRIILRRATTTADEFNEPVETWADLATVWAKATPVMDGERTAAGQTLATKQYRFVIRYSSTTASLDPRDRLMFDGREYDINGVKELTRRELLEITATAKAETP
jgi:SPP1 family predicted phage head-tail adaptor